MSNFFFLISTIIECGGLYLFKTALLRTYNKTKQPKKNPKTLFLALAYTPISQLH